MPRINPFTEIYRKCNDLKNRGDPAKLPAFPRYIDVELTNSCNFTCLMCPTGTGTSRRKKGFMSEEIFHKILTETAAHGAGLRFIGWGEPLLHPQLLTFLKCCRDKCVITHLNTNGSLLTDDMMQQFVNIPLDSLKFSFQGIDAESYREMRNTDFFNELILRIKKLHHIRGDKEKPFIHVSTTLTYESPEKGEQFRQMISPFVDLVTLGKTSLDIVDPKKVRLKREEKERLMELIEMESITKVHPSCPEVFNVLAVNWDGKVSGCCADYDNKMHVGDLHNDTLESIWKSAKMNTYRKLLAEMKHDTIEICRTCFDPMGLQKKSPS